MVVRLNFNLRTLSRKVQKTPKVASLKKVGMSLSLVLCENLRVTTSLSLPSSCWDVAILSAREYSRPRQTGADSRPHGSLLPAFQARQTSHRGLESKAGSRLISGTNSNGRNPNTCSAETCEDIWFKKSWILFLVTPEIPLSSSEGTRMLRG